MTEPTRLCCEHVGRSMVKTLEIEKNGRAFLIRFCGPCVQLMDNGGTAICRAETTAKEWRRS